LQTKWLPADGQSGVLQQLALRLLVRYAGLPPDWRAELLRVHRLGDDLAAGMDTAGRWAPAAWPPLPRGLKTVYARCCTCATALSPGR
jgi:hypothetical protein